MGDYLICVIRLTLGISLRLLDWRGARFVGYFELGTHEEEFEGKKRDREKVDLVFELSGPNHEPIKAADGTLIKPARSKNVIQEKIAAAKNWASHPLSKEAPFAPEMQEPPRKQTGWPRKSP
ncbi:Uncharacterised protein [Burkholderia pseudomallei]|nr:hypothetical protein [Burkholderia pseudomallei]CAJ2950661.1 Uncharacterised protein [Burkholderia pseudomallei]CAJ3678136.1 Uncharacterised protein [Burkholderia pseudomallei]CAJ4961354.1 Uncharacterised protein [Burkholderia pseudomallei]CAJ5499503.1 Uncharacterised protein [Burkholderia pseudomallei]CAJ5555541.1 Uncharacterised protein [Burkholderia pseudomallei]